MFNFYANLGPILAASSSKATTSSGAGSSIFLFLIVIAAFFWFAIIRPQKTRQKRLQQATSQLEPGDEVVTIGGIVGTIVSVLEDRIVLSVGPGIDSSGRGNPEPIEMIFLKQAIARKLDPSVLGSPTEDGMDEDGMDDGGTGGHIGGSVGGDTDDSDIGEGNLGEDETDGETNK